MDSSTGDQDRFKSGTTMKSRKSNQSIAHVGRPIAHYHNIKDPVGFILLYPKVYLPVLASRSFFSEQN